MASKLFKDRYQILRQLDNQGGMGFVVFATDTHTNSEVVIKFCKADSNEELQKRFKREVRLLEKYKDSGYVIPIIDSDLDTAPYYFVMPKAEGDLTELCHLDLGEKEKVFYRMIDCVSYIHKQGDLHRDIKPENFLRYNGAIVVSDLGLAKDPSSLTQFTKSIDVRGTPVYAPPNFFELNGGFKNPVIEDDLFSLGKSFYFILSGQVPFYILKNDIPDSLFEIIKKSTKDDRHDRYKSCIEFRDDIKKAFDIIFSRVDVGAEYIKAKRELIKNNSEMWQDNDQVSQFISLLMSKDGEEKTSVFEEISYRLFQTISTRSSLSNKASNLISIYKSIFEYVTSQKFWPFSYAETVANDISVLFGSHHIPVDIRAAGLKIALDFAIVMNRGAAGKTCARMIESVREDGLAILVGQVIYEYESEFVFSHCVKADSCHHDHIIKIILEKQKKSGYE